MRTFLTLFASTLVLLPTAFLGAAEPTPQESQEKLAKWIEVRRKIAEERAEWAEDRAILEKTAELLEQQKEALEAEIEALNASGSEADSTRNDLLLKRAELTRANDSFAGTVARLEAAAIDLSAHLPKPLRKKLEALIVRIPADPAETPISLGQRLVNVLGILLQTEKFDGTVTYAGETRKVSDGREMQVDQLYWGLAFALYVDASGQYAGIGLPGADGWSFDERNEMASQIRKLVDIYQGNTDAIEFVPAAIEVK